MNLATWSIRNPIPSILLFIMLTAAGFCGFRTMPIQDLPDIELPAVNVTLTPARRRAGAARDRGRPQGRGFDRDAVGLKHIRTSITDGAGADQRSSSCSRSRCPTR